MGIYVEKAIEEKIGEGLIRRGVMKQEQVKEVLDLQSKGDNRLFGEIALDLGFIEVRSLIDYLREKEN